MIQTTIQPIIVPLDLDQNSHKEVGRKCFLLLLERRWV